MELKFVFDYLSYVEVVCSNRTFMELKFRRWMNWISSMMSSNRTFMELKFEKKITEY